MEFDEEMMASLSLSTKDASEDGDAKLVDIIQFLRKALPTSALAPNETMSIPKGDHYECFTEQNTVHVDEFLYTDEEAEELKEVGLLSHDYCADCGSRNIKPLSTFTSLAPVQTSLSFAGLQRPILPDSLLQPLLLTTSSSGLYFDA